MRRASASLNRSAPAFGGVRHLPKLLVAQRHIAVEGGQENRPLVLERLVDAAGGEPHGADQVADRRGVVAMLAKYPDRLIERLVDMEFARASPWASGVGRQPGSPDHRRISGDHSFPKSSQSFVS